jgi:hypothetical protein
MSRIQRNTGFLFTPSQRIVNSWGDLSTGLNGFVPFITTDSSNNLYAGGNFTRAGDISVNRIAMWDGRTWNALGSGTYKGVNYSLDSSSTQVFSIVIDNSKNVIVGGFFDVVGNFVEANNIAKWDGTTWDRLSDFDSGMNNTVYSLALDNSNNLYAGGNFTTAGGLPANRIARWNGTSWSALGRGLRGSPFNLPRAIVVDSQNNVYVGGDFTDAGDISASKIAKWNGTTWSALGAGMNDKVNDLAFDNSNNLYACGDFTRAGDVSANYIAKWDGTRWSALPSEVNNNVLSIIFKNNNLYAGGLFTQAGSSNSPYFAVWNGTSWNNLNSTINSQVESVAVDNNGKPYVSGFFITVPGLRIGQLNQRNISSTNLINVSKLYKRIGII